MKKKKEISLCPKHITYIVMMIYDSKQNVVCVVSAREEHEGGGDAPQVSLLPPGQPPHWPAAGAQGGVKENI